MKQLKFLMVAFTLLTGISLTSCIGEGDPTVTDVTFGRIVSTFPTVVETPFGVKFTAVNSMDLDLYNDFVLFQYSYNSDLQKVDQNTKNIDATITVLEKLKYNQAYSQPGKGEEYETATIIKVGNGPESNLRFLYYDKSKIIIPVIFLMKEASKESLDKHDFSLCFDETDIKSGDREIKFYLRHKSSEDKPTKQVSSYRIFDINTALERFKGLAGDTPNKIIVYANESKENSSDALDKKKDELTGYSMNYEFKDTDK